jgi:hypothetical protein
MTTTPPIEVRPRRFASPFAGQRAKLEPIHQPLYSAYLFDAAIVGGEALLFQYAIGGTVASNIAAATVATQLHTNIQAAGFLPTPKVFLTTGIRIVPVELTSGLITPIDDTAAASVAAQTFLGNDSNLLEDLMRILYGSYVRFFVGTKDYLVAPCWMTPANTGIDGESSNQIALGASVTNVAERQFINTFHSMGRYFALNRYPVLIPSQQNFFISINFPQTTRPTLGATRPVYGVLDGILGRETQ